MSLGVENVACSVVSPKEHKKSPFILDESIPKSKSPQEVQRAIYKKQYGEMIKNLESKNLEELSSFERGILYADRLNRVIKDMPTVVYLA